MLFLAFLPLVASSQGTSDPGLTPPPTGTSNPYATNQLGLSDPSDPGLIPVPNPADLSGMTHNRDAMPDLWRDAPFPPDVNPEWHHCEWLGTTLSGYDFTVLLPADSRVYTVPNTDIQVICNKPFKNDPGCSMPWSQAMKGTYSMDAMDGLTRRCYYLPYKHALDAWYSAPEDDTHYCNWVVLDAYTNEPSFSFDYAGNSWFLFPWTDEALLLGCIWNADEGHASCAVDREVHGDLWLKYPHWWAATTYCVFRPKAGNPTGVSRIHNPLENLS